jgi:hypothetical protein
MMRFQPFSGRAGEQRCDCLVIGVYERGELGEQGRAADRSMRGRIRALLARGDFLGRAGETLLLTETVGVRAPRLLLVGLGPMAQPPRLAAGLRHRRNRPDTHALRFRGACHRPPARARAGRLLFRPRRGGNRRRRPLSHQ